MLDRITEIWLSAISLAFPLCITAILIGLAIYNSWEAIKCDHKWVRYIIKKSANGINYRCVICKKCGKAHIEEPGGLITIEEVFFGDGVIDFKKLWAEAETPDLEFEEFLKAHGVYD